MKFPQHRRLTSTEIVWLRRILALTVWSMSAVARADVFGQNLLNWAAPIFAGLGIIALVGGLALAMFNPRMAAMAVATRRVRLGTFVTPVPRRRPWKLASEAVTLDHLSHGRLILGAGAGDVNDAGVAATGEAAPLRAV